MPATAHRRAMVMVSAKTRAAGATMGASRATMMSARTMHINQFLSLFIKFCFLATKEARITLPNSAAVIIIMVGGSKETLMRRTNLSPVRIVMICSTEETGRTGSYFAAVCIVMYSVSEEARAALADLATAAVVVDSGAKPTRTTCDFFLSHNLSSKLWV